MTDPVADLLTRIRNACLEKHEKVEVPASRLKANIVKVLKEEGFIKTRAGSLKQVCANWFEALRKQADIKDSRSKYFYNRRKYLEEICKGPPVSLYFS